MAESGGGGGELAMAKIEREQERNPFSVHAVHTQFTLVVRLHTLGRLNEVVNSFWPEYAEHSALFVQNSRRHPRRDNNIRSRKNRKSINVNGFTGKALKAFATRSL
jgi:hypothetical protein